MLLWDRLSLLLPWRRHARENCLDEELRSHIELATDDALREGTPLQEATFVARRDLGSSLRVKEEARSVWGFPMWDRFKQDLIYSARTLRKAQTFTIVAILSLAVGIGSTTAIFSLVNTILLKPLGYGHPNQLVNIREVVPPLAKAYPSLPVNYDHFLFWRQYARSFESLAAIEGGTLDLTGVEPIKLDIAVVTPNLFSLLGVQPQSGRSFLPDEGQRGRNQVAVITDSLWRRRFGAATDVVGKTITLNYVPYTVIGVLPAAFKFPKNDDLGALVQLGKNIEIFLPFSGHYMNDWDGDYDYAVIARLKPNVSIERASAELDTLERQIDREHKLGGGLRVICRPLQDVIAAPIRAPLYLLMAAVLLLLLIVCVNLANLVLARSSVRAREFAIRMALGAGATRLVQQLLTETLLLSLIGGALGLIFAALSIHAFVVSTSVRIPRLDEVRVDDRVFFFSLVVSVACGLFSGLLPAVRMRKVDSQETLRAGSHILAGIRQSLRLREILIGCEVAISVVLLFGAGLMMTSLVRLLSTDKGFTTEQAVVIDISLPFRHYKSGQDDIRFWDQALEQLRSIPSVESAAFTSKMPLTGESMVNDIILDGADQGALDPASRTKIQINVRYVSSEYFKTLGIPVIRGRVIEPYDHDRRVAVISTRLAAMIWPGQNPLGKKFSTGAGAGKVEVIGVVKDVHATRLDQEPTLMAYVPYWLRGLAAGSLVIRTADDPASLIPVIRKRIQALDPSLPVPESTTVAKLVSQSFSRRYFQLRLASGFASAALALALIGIYGLVAYTTAQRRTEIAVRLALGATPFNVLQILLQRGIRPVLIGLLVGLFCAAALAQLIRPLLYGVKATDPLTMLLVILVMSTTALCACVLPACAAVRTDPATALRYE